MPLRTEDPLTAQLALDDMPSERLRTMQLGVYELLGVSDPVLGDLTLDSTDHTLDTTLITLDATVE